MTNSGERPFLTVRELAQRWNVSDRTIRRQVKARLLAGFRVGKQLRFDPAVIKDYERRRDGG
jgi:excisionase family DNA binding protein